MTNSITDGARKPPEDYASEAIARCVAENAGENVAYYVAEAIREAVEAERRRRRGGTMQSRQIGVITCAATWTS